MKRKAKSKQIDVSIAITNLEKTTDLNWLWGRNKDLKKSTDQIMKEIDEGEYF